MEYLEHITIDPEICHSKPCVRGMRWRVEVMRDKVSSEMTSRKFWETTRIGARRHHSRFELRQVAVIRGLTRI
ncbi:MAG: DUF433 domain-containing protein [Saprospiraceae bacterium]|nr:DUF433 domain-containing protein [Saprospiraceae bacterium]